MILSFVLTALAQEPACAVEPAEMPMPRHPRSVVFEGCALRMQVKPDGYVDALEATACHAAAVELAWIPIHRWRFRRSGCAEDEVGTYEAEVRFNTVGSGPDQDVLAAEIAQWGSVEGGDVSSCLVALSVTRAGELTARDRNHPGCLGVFEEVAGAKVKEAVSCDVVFAVRADGSAENIDASACSGKARKAAVALVEGGWWLNGTGAPVSHTLRLTLTP